MAEVIDPPVATPPATPPVAAPATPPASPPAPAPPKTALASDPPAAAVQSDWPTDWRSKLAAGDEAALKRLERFGAVTDIFKSYRALESKLTSGELKTNTPFPKTGTDAEKATWRAEQGIPEAADKYDLKFDSGLVIGKDDKPMVDEFLKSAHDANMRPEHAKATVEWYFKTLETQQAEREKADDTAVKAAEDALRPEWGNDYRRNVNLITGFLDTAPESVRDHIKGARLPDGTLLANSPDVLRWLLNNATQINPVTTIIPGVSGANLASSIEDEIAGIEKMLRTDRASYNKSETIQARYRELLGARDKLKAK